MNNLPLLSVVVIGRNEGSRLQRCLRSVLAMDWPEDALELIYVDSASSDRSVPMARELGARVVLLSESQRGAARARNAGWQLAHGEWILFLDGDVLLHPQFARRALAEIQRDENIAAVWGHRRELRPSQSMYVRVLDLDWRYPLGDSPYCGGDALFRRSALEQSGGFCNELPAGEEPELCGRLRAANWRIVHIDEPMTLHDLAITRFSQYWRRALRTGYAYADVCQRFRHSGDPLWLRESRHNLRHSAYLLGGGGLGIYAALSARSLVPLLLLLALALLLWIRTIARAAWRSNEPRTLVWFALHALLQHIPISIGQGMFWFDQWRLRRSRQVDYKAEQS